MQKQKLEELKESHATLQLQYKGCRQLNAQMNAKIKDGNKQ